MKVTIQRVSQAHVIVDQMTVGKIAEGLLIFLGVSETDDLTTVKKMKGRDIKVKNVKKYFLPEKVYLLILIMKIQ